MNNIKEILFLRFRNFIHLFGSTAFIPFSVAYSFPFGYNKKGIVQRRGDIVNRKAKLPIGIENFEKIRTMGFYYVDKTALIQELLDNWEIGRVHV